MAGPLSDDSGAGDPATAAAADVAPQLSRRQRGTAKDPAAIAAAKAAKAKRAVDREAKKAATFEAARRAQLQRLRQSNGLHCKLQTNVDPKCSFFVKGKGKATLRRMLAHNAAGPTAHFNCGKGPRNRRAGHSTDTIVRRDHLVKRAVAGQIMAGAARGAQG